MKTRNYIDLTGKKFGYILVLKRSDKRGKKNEIMWECQCECGLIGTWKGNALKTGNTKSCGCKQYKRRAGNDITGMKTGKLTVLCKSNRKDRSGKILWECRCDCGNMVAVEYGRLFGNTRSCGCLISETWENKVIHGHARQRNHSREYDAWADMKKRCLNKNADRYECYGGRGITICDEWINNFKQFLSDMGLCPSGYSLERKNVNGNYDANNCEWIPLAMQAKNTRKNRFIAWNGKVKILSDWMKEFNVGHDIFYTKIKNGLSDMQALEEISMLREERGGS